jgi:hypothetical protein
MSRVCARRRIPGRSGFRLFGRTIERGLLGTISLHLVSFGRFLFEDILLLHVAKSKRACCFIGERVGYPIVFSLP